jgi:hypothetical protein
VHIHCRRVAAATIAALAFRPCCAEHDLAYVAEHLPEAAMDNRYATLPVWAAGSPDASRGWEATLQGALSVTKVGTISLEGPLLGIALRRALGKRWQLGMFGFYDDLSFSVGREFRPLQTLFAPQTPIDRPANALFTNLDGRAKNLGGGLYAARTGDAWLLGRHRWVAGILWQSVELSDYRFDYQIVDGPQSSLSGQIDFDATYDYVTPFAGLEIPRDFGRWTIAMHALLAYPLPVQGVAGHITGPGFDFAGDTASAGAGKHFGNPSLTLGLDLAYRPARLSFDIGTVLSQELLEPVAHPGIERNLVLSFSWTY